MFSRVVRDLDRIQFEAALTFSYVIDPGYVGTHFINHLHKLWKANNEGLATDTLYKTRPKCES